jgi:hypothetical protein
MIKIYNELNQEFICCSNSTITQIEYNQLVEAFIFCLTVPMNLLWASEKNKIMVNGRDRPFATLKIQNFGDNILFYKWVMINPIYSITEDERLYQVNFDFRMPPLPIECWKFYKSYYKRLEIYCA